jgi:arylsulfatase A-like enzyme
MSEEPDKTTPRPSFLVFCLDQIGAHSLGAYGNSDARTPNIDRLASRGRLALRAYCNNPVCMPSRATLITGLTPRQHGCVTNGVPLPADVPTVGQALSKAGYRTFSAGKLHLQPGLDAGKREALPEFSWEDAVRWNAGQITSLPEGYYGFAQSAYVSGHVSGCYGQYAQQMQREHPGLLEAYAGTDSRTRGDNILCWQTEVPAELHYNHWIADRTIDFLSQAGREPFFAWCSFPDPHGPWAAAREYADAFDPDALKLPEHWNETEDPLEILSQYRRKLPDFLRVLSRRGLAEVTAQTYGMLEHIDANIGRVVEALKRNGQADNTVIVLLADHGEYLGAHGLVGKTPWPYQELLRIPMLYVLPDSVGDGEPGPLETPVSTLDFVPTVLDLAGVDASGMFQPGRAKSRLELPGQSLLPWLHGDQTCPDRAIVCEFDNTMHRPLQLRMRTLIRRDYKLTLYDNQQGGLLFHLPSDPLERRNLWSDPQHQSARHELTEQLLRRLITGDRFVLPRWIGA